MPLRRTSGLWSLAFIRASIDRPGRKEARQDSGSDLDGRRFFVRHRHLRHHEVGHREIRHFDRLGKIEVLDRLGHETQRHLGAGQGRLFGRRSINVREEPGILGGDGDLQLDEHQRQQAEVGEGAAHPLGEGMQPGHHAGQGTLFATAEEVQLGLVQSDAGLEAGAQFGGATKGADKNLIKSVGVV